MVLIFQQTPEVSLVMVVSVLRVFPMGLYYFFHYAAGYWKRGRGSERYRDLITAGPRMDYSIERALT